MKAYLDNYITLDPGFVPFAEKYSSKYDFILLSNDIAPWSRHLTEHYALNRYFKAKLVSGDLDCRKPQKSMYRMALTASWNEAQECLFVDNTVRNLRSAREFFSIPTVLFEREKSKWDGDRVSSFEELGAFLDKTAEDQE